MNNHSSHPLFAPKRPRLSRWHRAVSGALAVATGCLVFGWDRAGAAQTTAGPYSNYNYNSYPGPIYYNQGYAQYGLPGVGVSPWDPIVQAQLNLGMRTARYNMYSSWADQSNAAANLYYQQAVAQSIKNEQQQQAMQPRYDVRLRTPRPAQASESNEPKLLPRNNLLKSDGAVIWPETAPSSNMLDKSRSAAEAAIRVAVKEFEADGKASTQSVAEAKSQLFAYGKPALQQLVRTDRDDAKKLLKFLASLEHMLDGLAGE